MCSCGKEVFRAKSANQLAIGLIEQEKKKRGEGERDEAVTRGEEQRGSFQGLLLLL